MLRKEVIHKGVRYTIIGLPLAGIIVCSFLNLMPITRQLLILAALVWMQVFLIMEVFLAG